MNIITPDSVFQENTLNIFTDASIKTINNTYVGCAGAVAVLGALQEQNMVEEYQIFDNTTNNNSEIKAVRLGIELALRYRNRFEIIRLFSDSQISIFGIRERIFKWQMKDGQYIGVEGNPIKNQDIMLEIVNTIINRELKIEFYHQKGHVNINDKNNLLKAIHVFSASNNIRDVISYDFIKTISQLNNIVDVNSRNKLAGFKKFDPRPYSYEPLIFNYDGFDKEKYLELIKY